MSDPGYARPPHPARRWPLKVLILTDVLLVAALLIAGFELRDLRQQVSRDGRALAAVSRAQASAERTAQATATSVQSTRSQLAALAAQQTSAQNQMKADEQQLSITKAALPPDVTKLASQVSPSVVLISCGDGLGTGFALALAPTAGFSSVVVTAEHVVHECVPGAASPTARPAVGITSNGLSLVTSLRSSDPRADVALLDVEEKIPALEPGAAPVTGQFVLAVGNPLGVVNNVTPGIVSRVNADFFLNTAPISNGNSGGPLVDRSGQVLGIADASNVPDAAHPVVQNLNYGLRLASLCSTLLTGPTCAALH